MAEIKDGGPAYPAHDYIVGDLQRDGFQKLGQTRGMSLRDYFAGQALAGIAARMDNAAFADIRNEVRGGLHEARVAYQLADALIKVRDGSHV